MPKFSINLSMLFQEVPFLERFSAAAKAGAKAVEFMFPYEYPAEQLRDILDQHSLKLVLFNLPAGNWAAGDRGIAIDPKRQEEFREGVAKAAMYAQVLGVEQINCLVGKKILDVPGAFQYRTMIQNLQYAADILAQAQLKLLIEPLNSRDMPGFTLTTTQQVFSAMEDINRPNVFLQYDMYHAQRMEGELIGNFKSHLKKIAHIQIADNPGRHEPGTGEINYPAIFTAIDECGFGGYVGLEYIPKVESNASLAWVKQYGYGL